MVNMKETAVCILSRLFSSRVKVIRYSVFSCQAPRKAGMAITALMGPVSNLVAAFAGYLVFQILWAISPTFLTDGFGSWILTFLTFYASVNVQLAVFNLLPIPPLDGSKVMFTFLPDRAVEFLYRYQMVFFAAIFVLLWTGPLSRLLSYLSTWVMYGVYQLSALPFQLFGVTTVPFTMLYGAL